MTLSPPPNVPSSNDSGGDDSRAGLKETVSGITPEKSTENFNFGVMSWHSVLIRTGWIFKTESIVMPAMLDALSGAAWIRGFLPMLNRFGQSVPPLLAAGYVRG